MLCSTTNVFCDEYVEFPIGLPLVAEELNVLMGLGSWHQTCATPLAENTFSIGVYADIRILSDWIQRTVYENEGPGTGISSRGNSFRYFGWLGGV